MGFVQVIGACVCCKQLFAFHPHKVPSIRIHGSPQPICAGCVEIANVKRKANGLDPIVPLPGAYEAADEHEMFVEEDD